VSEESDLFGLGTAAIGFIDKANFKLVNLGDVSNFSPRELEDMSIAANITRFRRPEDSAWDPRRGEKHRNDAYFVTTADINTNVVSGACASTTSAKLLKRAARSKSC
jgi:hypothetical protein